MSPIAALLLALKGATVVDAEPVFDVERSISHGNVAAAHVMAGKLGPAPAAGPGVPGPGHRPCADHFPGGAAGIETVYCPLVECRGYHPGT
jgi:hypothetical protein